MGRSQKRKMHRTRGVHRCWEREEELSRNTLRSWLVSFAQMGVLNSSVLTQLLETDTNNITPLLKEEMETQRG